MNSESALTQAAAQLKEKYGISTVPSETTRWKQAVWIVIGTQPTNQKLRAFDHLLLETALNSPDLTATAAVETIAEAVRPLTRSRQTHALLKRFAVWWTEQPDPEAASDWEAMRNTLRTIPGMGPGLTDRLVLFAWHLPVLPRDRSAMRVAVRHGWIDESADDEEWQAMPRGSLFESSDDQFERVHKLQQFSSGLSRVGSEYCGPHPKCDGCPLKPCLPPGGPIEPES